MFTTVWFIYTKTGQVCLVNASISWKRTPRSLSLLRYRWNISRKEILTPPGAALSYRCVIISRHWLILLKGLEDVPKEKLWTSAEMPTVGEARGKIVLTTWSPKTRPKYPDLGFIPWGGEKLEDEAKYIQVWSDFDIFRWQSRIYTMAPVCRQNGKSLWLCGLDRTWRKTQRRFSWTTRLRADWGLERLRKIIRKPFTRTYSSACFYVSPISTT